MIQIILNNNKNDQPERITYGFHHGGQTFEWNREEVSKSVDGNHPLVYVTLGRHGCWNIPGDNAWYQVLEKCRECIDETSDDGNVLYPSTMSSSQIQAIADKYS